jgi:hypothetical protein
MVLRCIAANRSPDSYVAGSTVFNKNKDSVRYSNHIDLFHDPTLIIQDSFDADRKSLIDAGLQVDLILERRTFIKALVSDKNESVKLEWTTDSAFRFFPVIKDNELGFRLHDFDSAVNKILALAGRSVARDLIDILYIHDKMFHLGTLCFAASGRDPGLTPDLILELIIRNGKLSPESLIAENLISPIDPIQIKKRYLKAIDEAKELLAKLPAKDIGCVYVDSSGNVSRVPKNSDTPHFGSIKGAWPVIVE